MYEEKNKSIRFNKNKIVLLSKLLKDLKNKLNTITQTETTEKKLQKLNTERRLIETLLDGNAINKKIDNLKNQLENEENPKIKTYSATHKTTGKKATGIKAYSKKQARYYNKYLENFEETNESVF